MMISKLVIATRNRGKLTEIQHFLVDLPIAIYSLDDFPQIGEIEETATTFVENALIKAREVCRQTGLPALADDSGVVVEALNGAPGLYSARYAGIHGDHHANIEKLLQEMAGVEDRTLHFHSTIVLLRSIDDPDPLITQGNWYGEMLSEKRGTKGHGYDPIFWIPELQCSAAELDLEVKNRISHRGQALQKLAALLHDDQF